MKKKSIAAISCIMVVVMLLLTGCGGNNGETGGDKDSGKLSPYQLSSSEKQLAMMMVGSTAPVMMAGFEGAKDYKEMNTGVEYYEHGKLVNGKSGTKMTCDLTDLGDDSGKGMVAAVIDGDVIRLSVGTEDGSMVSQDSPVAKSYLKCSGKLMSTLGETVSIKDGKRIYFGAQAGSDSNEMESFDMSVPPEKNDRLKKYDACLLFYVEFVK